MKFASIEEEDKKAYRRRYFYSFLFSFACFFLLIIVCFSFVPISERLVGFLRFSLFYLFASLDYFSMRGASVKSSQDEQKICNTKNMQITCSVCGFIFVLNFLLYLMGFRASVI